MPSGKEGEWKNLPNHRNRPARHAGVSLLHGGSQIPILAQAHETQMSIAGYGTAAGHRFFIPTHDSEGAVRGIRDIPS